MSTDMRFTEGEKDFLAVILGLAFLVIAVAWAAGRATPDDARPIDQVAACERHATKPGEEASFGWGANGVPYCVVHDGSRLRWAQTPFRPAVQNPLEPEGNH